MDLNNKNDLINYTSILMQPKNFENFILHGIRPDISHLFDSPKIESSNFINESSDDKVKVDESSDDNDLQEIEKYLNELSSKLNVSFVLLNPESYLCRLVEIAARISPVNERDAENIRQNGIFIGNRDENISDIIVYNLINLLIKYKENKNILKIVTMHEYGHILTKSQLTEDDYKDYYCKINLAHAIVNSLSQIDNISDEQKMANSAYLVYQLKPEVLANKLMHLNSKNLVEMYFHVSPEIPTSFSIGNFLRIDISKYPLLSQWSHIDIYDSDSISEISSRDYKYLLIEYIQIFKNYLLMGNLNLNF